MHSEEELLAALAWLDLRPPRAGGSGPVPRDGADDPPRSLAAWSPAGTVAAPRVERDADVERQHEIVASRELGVLPEDLASGARLAMTWDELGDLAERHVVLGHTDDHVTAASIVTEADVERQVRGPLRLVRERIGRDAAGWAWAGGTPLSDGPGDRALAQEGVPLLVSNCFVEPVG